MKNRIIVFIGIFFLVGILHAQWSLADSSNTPGTPVNPIQVSPSSSVGNTLPSALPQDRNQITPPASTSVNPNVPSPTNPGNINVNPVTIPGSNVPSAPPSTPTNPTEIPPGTAASPTEPVINNYSSQWFFSPWFISLLVLILVIVLLVVYSLVEGKMPKEEKEQDTAVSGKKKKIKK